MNTPYRPPEIARTAYRRKSTAPELVPEPEPGFPANRAGVKFAIRETARKMRERELAQACASPQTAPLA